MRGWILFAPLALSMAACQGGGDNSRSGKIHVADQDHVSFAELDGWSLRHDRGTWVQVGQGERELSTISIRSVDRNGWSEDRSPELVLPATETSLRALPSAQVHGPKDLDHPVYPASVFAVTFEPRSKKGKRYQRRHVVVFGDQRIFHVLLTAPDGAIENSQKPFDTVVNSVREEG